MWGYKPIPGAKSPDDEKKTLDEWAKVQDTTPWLRFSTNGSRGSDPGENTEAVGDGDAVASTALGIKNLERVSKMLLPATTEAGEPWDDLDELYGRMLGQWATEMGHVVAIVGGFNSQQKHGGQEGVRFTPVPRAKQAAAVEFISQKGFATPTWAINPDILRRIEPTGVLDRIETAQRRMLNGLLNNARIDRLIEQDAVDGAAAYHPADFLGDVRKGVWGELSGGSVKIDAYRRNLQRSYLELLAEKLNGRAAVTDDIRALIRGELRDLNTSIGTAVARTTDRATRLHLLDVRDQIAKTLDPKFPPPAPTTPASPFGFGGSLDVNPFVDSEPMVCWPDYAIRRSHD
jgi:hypothetical protein